MNIAKALKALNKAAPFLPLAEALMKAFKGDKRAAMRQIRKWELDQRDARDQRIRRKRTRK